MKRFSGVSALALCALTTPALADVTPQQVWDDLEAYMQGFGYSVTATEMADGGNLKVNDVVMSIPVPDIDGSVAFSMGTMDLTDQGDGTVLITFPADMPVMIKGTDGGDEIDVTINFTQEDMKLVVSGEPNNLTYDYTATKMAMSLGKMMADGMEITRDMLRADIVAGPISGKSTVLRAAGLQSVSQTFDYGNLTYDVAFNDPDNDDAALFNGALNGLTGSGETVMPEGVDYADPTALFEGGFGVDVTMGHQGGRLEFAVTERSGTTQGKTSSGSGSLTIAMSGDAMTYKVGGTDVKVDMSGPEIPLPVSAQMAETGFTLAAPLKPGDAPQDATLEVVLGGFQMADLLWNIFDPGAQLPRDPATIRVAMDAKVSPLVNFLNEDDVMKMEMEGSMPGELNEVTLRELVIDAVGGKITGSGAFTFDNTDLDSFDGLPRPEGKLDVAVSGANGLIDKLIGMGLLSEEDAMGGRMMLGMFTVPGAEPDTATSVIEVNAEGHVLANGQRLK
ncbi:hypothetical protein TRP8649_00969 [Pelagimonas phthalicica]|uniref:DUF2125 domain-containing protein n=1 Tax=Pelagimonas phthalicica TaxID=1037362 RepID=A0A238J818_9RHOB|nr:DUF2125 domain-containing protein [Pelagimonas phthalicica]TDS94601.1 uncharacterized protein DUF2125 [Pelagimonas phthalicica]SMX26871.1 hypothetical protein TRP8649_00969 [Pelagimonas phthalicica]